MIEENPEKLAKLIEDYRVEYQKMQAMQEHEVNEKRRKLEDIEDELMGTDDTKRAAELYQEYMQEHKRRQGESKMQEKASGSGGPAQYVEPEAMSIDQVMTEEWTDQEHELALTQAYLHVDSAEESGEYAWDDVTETWTLWRTC